MPKYAALENGALYTLSPLKFPFYATLCEPWCVAPTADGTGNFNEKYYKIPLTYLELTTFLTLEKILEKAKVPRAVEPVSDMCRVPWEKLAGLASAFTPFALPSLRDNESGKKPDANSVPDSEEITRLRRATRDFIQCGAERGERNNRLFRRFAIAFKTAGRGGRWIRCSSTLPVKRG